MKIVIVGCGGLGSTLAIKVIMYKKELRELVLIDNDIFEKDNILCEPFATGPVDLYINQPKSLVIAHTLRQITNKKIYTEVEFFTKNKLRKYKEYIKIDCRDNKITDSNFDYKLTMDGAFALINTMPDDSHEDIQTNYTLQKSYTYIEKLSFIFSFFIGKDYFKKGKYIINLLEGEIINVTNTNERIRIPVSFTTS